MIDEKWLPTDDARAKDAVLKQIYELLFPLFLSLACSLAHPYR